jgi:hypothetical protein
VFFRAHNPQALRKMTMRKTRNLFLALPSMIFSIINLARFAVCRIAYGSLAGSLYGVWLHATPFAISHKLLNNG